MCYLLREASRNATDLQKWSVLDATRNVVVAWDKDPSCVIVNCIMKSGFGTKVAEEFEFEQVFRDKHFKTKLTWSSLLAKHQSILQYHMNISFFRKLIQYTVLI